MPSTARLPNGEQIPVLAVGEAIEDDGGAYTVGTLRICSATASGASICT